MNASRIAIEAEPGDEDRHRRLDGLTGCNFVAGRPPVYCMCTTVFFDEA
jgi:hypothetical protein